MTLKLPTRSVVDPKSGPELGAAQRQDVTPRPGTVDAADMAPGSLSPAALTAIVNPADLRCPALYLNRELSWLEFNARVMSEAENLTVPLLERLKFHAIFASNLDEFFMVRVAGLKQQIAGDVDDIAPDGMPVSMQLSRIARRVQELVSRQWKDLSESVLPALRQQGYWLFKPSELPQDERAKLDERFNKEIFPILTPIAIDPGHPFPHVRNKSLNIGVMFQKENAVEVNFGVVQVPMMLSRLVEVPPFQLPDGSSPKHAFVLLEDVIARQVATIFPGVKVRGVYTFRVTRNFDIEIDEEESEDLIQEIQQELRRRERGNAVRLEVSGDFDPASLTKLASSLKVDQERDVFRVPMLNVPDLLSLVTRDDRRELKDDPFTPLVTPPLRDAEDLFAVIRDQDILLHHPYESFDPVVELITRAAEDPGVLAIKQTLYRAGGDSPIVRALARAAEAGKQVTAIVELQARFDEASNIAWARMLEQSGVHVVYGLLGLKTHAKCLLIVRREKNGLRRYVHLSTGNYNTTTSRTYTDVGLLTCRPEFGEDASSLFNLLTGYSAPAKWNSLVVAPLGLHEAVLGLIARETENAQRGKPARIIAKMNSLVDEDAVEALYRASQAGVQITLLIRGVCVLRPGIPGVSENIEVRALIDRYLEHARVFYFLNGGKNEIYLSSADWMPRNFHRRIEVMVPIEDPKLRDRLVEMLHITMADNVKAWPMSANGTYERSQVRIPRLPFRSQQRFIEMTRDCVKASEQSTLPASRFSMAASSLRSPLEGKVPKATRRRVRLDGRDGPE